MPTSDIGFGHSLRREREGRVITLEAVADETKVSPSLLAGLEEDDLSRWPGDCAPRASSAEGIEEESPIQASLQFTPERSERLRQNRREPSPDD